MVVCLVVIVVGERMLFVGSLVGERMLFDVGLAGERMFFIGSVVVGRKRDSEVSSLVWTFCHLSSFGVLSSFFEVLSSRYHRFHSSVGVFFI